MSLLQYTDSLIGKVTGGAICGFDGSIWSATPGFYGDSSEFRKFIDSFNPRSPISYNGLRFQNENYVITSITDQKLIAQKSSSHVICIKCPKCYVIGYHDELIPPDICYNALDILAQALSTSPLVDEL